MKKFFVVFFLMGMTLGGLFADMGGQVPPQKIPVLYLIQSKSASLVPQSGMVYTLTLYNVNKFVIYFADRPNRNSGMIHLNNFLSNWGMGQNSFQQDNPNAGLAGVIAIQSGEGNQIMISVEISNPMYDAHMGKVSFNARILDPKDAPKLPCNLIIEPTLFIDPGFIGQASS